MRTIRVKISVPRGTGVPPDVWFASALVESGTDENHVFCLNRIAKRRYQEGAATYELATEEQYQAYRNPEPTASQARGLE